MPLSMPSLRQASSGTLTTTRGTNSMSKTTLAKPEPGSTMYTGTPDWSGVNNVKLTNYEGPSFSNGNPIYTSGFSNLQYGDQNLRIPKALAQLLARESQVNGTRGGLSTLFQGKSPASRSAYSSNAVEMDRLDKMNSKVAEMSPRAFIYGDTLVEKQNLENELAQAQKELAAPTVESGGPAFQSTIQTQRQQRIKDLQDRISGLSPVLNDRNNYLNAGRAPDQLNSIRKLLDNWRPTTSNLPIKETVSM